MEDEDRCSKRQDSSDSDDDLDAMPKLFSKKPPDASATSNMKEAHSSPLAKITLDDLVSEHVEQAAEKERLEKVKEQLLKDLDKDSQDMSQSNSQSLTSEHEEHLDKLDIKSCDRLVQPGLDVFNNDRVCSLFSQNVCPFTCGFTSSNSSIDKVIANTTPETLSTLLLSKALVACAAQITDIDSVLLWLLSILSIHSIPVTAYTSYKNIIGILHRFEVKSLTESPKCWCPDPLKLLRIFVNLGADPQDILGRHTTYSQDQISKCLTKENNENCAQQQKVKGKLCKDNIRMIFQVLARALQAQSHLKKEELNQMFYMLAKVELDKNVNRSLNLEAGQCFSAILQSYTGEDWPGVVPSLCRQLLEVFEHHHNRFHVADTISDIPRGTFLRVRLSYVCLRHLLAPDSEDLTDQEILNFKLSDIANFGCTSERPPISKLAESLRSLLEKDMYTTHSALKLLDLCVADDLERLSHPWQTLDYLINQIHLVIKSIKDNVNAMNSSKIKDVLCKLKFKWSLCLQEHLSISNQRSIMHWITLPRQELSQEVLTDSHPLLEDDLDTDL